MHRFWIIGAGLLLSVGVVVGFFFSRGDDNDTLSKPMDLTVFFTCDTRGMLTPCNCFTGQLGGLTRLRTLYDSTDKPLSLKVDIGDAIRGPEDYNVIEYRYILSVYAQMGYAAVNLGKREAELGRDVLAGLIKESPVPLLSANILDAETGALLTPGYRIAKVDGARVGIVGVVDEELVQGQLGEGLRVEPMELALSRVVPQLASQVDCLVLLAFADEQALAGLAERFYELDVILGGSVSQPASELKRVNQSLVSYVTNESRALGRLDLELSPGGQVRDIDHEIRLVNEWIPQSQTVLDQVEAFRREVKNTKLEIDFPEMNSKDLVPGVNRVAEYVGTDSCLPCHQESAHVWERSGHSKAWQTLVNAGSDHDPNCISCHSVGFGSPSGYRRSFDGAKLVDVGCETCHGPGSLHVQQRSGGEEITFHFRPLGAGDCMQCHYGKFSRPFDYDTWWPRVEHGESQNKVPQS